MKIIEDRRRLPITFPAQDLLAEMRDLPTAAWVDHFVQANYQGSWRILPLRGPAGATHPILMATAHPGQDTYEDTPFLAMAPAFQKGLHQLRCGLRSVRIMALGTGSRIREHRDPDLDGAGGIIRLHVPLLTHESVRFVLNGTPVPMKSGECWFLRLSDPHAVDNPGLGERIHLVIDAQLNPWLECLLTLPEPAPSLLAFMDRIGLSWEPAVLDETTFLPGLRVHQGRLQVDAARLRYPGDILHEAGHLAVTPALERPRVGSDNMQDPGLEIATLAWSYAACLHLGIAPEVVFHPDGYKGEAVGLVAAFRAGGTLGQPLLAWFGLTSWGTQGDGVVRFPAMVRWLRD